MMQLPMAKSNLSLTSNLPAEMCFLPTKAIAISHHITSQASMSFSGRVRSTCTRKSSAFPFDRNRTLRTLPAS